MELGVLERIRLLGILPEQGDIGTLKIVRRLRESLSFSEEEIKEMEISFVRSAGQIEYKWNNKKEKPLVIEFKPMSLRIITDALRDANKAKRLTEQHISIYEKFFGDTPEDE